MRLTTRSVIAALIAAVCFFATSPQRPCEAAAGSSDYTVTLLSGLYETPPATATKYVFANPKLSASITLPFTFHYFGAPHDKVLFVIAGYIHFTDLGSSGAASNTRMDPIPANNIQGVCAPLWGNLYPNAPGAIASYFTAGTAPNRRAVFTWEGYGDYNVPAGYATFQVKFYETSDRIEFAYKPDGFPSTFTGIKYSCGLDAEETDPRWVVPVNGSQFNSGFPANDYRFDPRLVDVTGHFTYPRYTASAGGLTGPTDAPLGNVQVEVRTGTSVLSSGFIDADGDLAMKSQVPPPTTASSIYLTTRTSGCSVIEPNASVPEPLSYLVASDPNFAAAIELGTIYLGAPGAAADDFRRAASVADAVQRVHTWASSRATRTIPAIDVWCSTSSPAATDFARPITGGSAAHLRIAGPAAANPDVWDDAVIQRAYGRHVLGAVASYPGPLNSYDSTFDKVTNEENAFAEAFGCYLAAAVDGTRTIHDTSSAAAATSIDLESGSLVTAKGDDVAGWIAMALYDLVDPANETSDRTDGTTADTAADALRAAGAIVGAPTVTSFVGAWQSLGKDPYAMSRTFVAHGLLADDALELNDEAAEATDLGAVPVRRTGLTLNIGNEDWFKFTLSRTATPFIVEMDFARSANQADIRIDLYDAAGALLATKVDGGLGPVVLSRPTLVAGTYRVRLRHVIGTIAPNYTFQAAEKLTVATTPTISWTVGQPFDRAVPVSGGHPPYTFEYVPASGNTSGIGFLEASLRAAGTPTRAGTSEFSLVVRDAGTPSHEFTAPHRIVINPPLQFDLGGVLAFPADRAFDVALDVVGGTAPLAFTVDQGSLPEGATLQSDDLRVSGSAVPPGSARLRISGVDVAGSAHAEAVAAVACTKLAGKATVGALAEGDSACGFWFDAVLGSVADVTISTAKKQPKRALHVVVTGPGGTVVTSKLKDGNGKASAASIQCSATGRHYVVVTSATGAPTSLQATYRLRLPKSGKSTVAAFGDGSTFDVRFGAVAGAELKLTATMPKGSPTTLSIAGVFAPDGTPQPLAGIVTGPARTVSVKTKLEISGTWTVRVRGNAGDPGKLAWSYSLRQPKGVSYEEN